MRKPEVLWAVFPFFLFSLVKHQILPSAGSCACVFLRRVTMFVLRLPRRSRRSDGETEPDDENEEKSDHFSRRIFYYHVIEAQIGCQRVSLGDMAKTKQKKQRNKWRQGYVDDSK